MLKLLAMAVKDMPKVYNSFTFLDSFWYTGIWISGSIMIFEAISAAVRIGRRRVHFDINSHLLCELR